jgi:MFS family permease
MEALVSPAVAALLLTLVSYNNLFIGTVGGFVFSALMVAITVLPKSKAADTPAASLWHRTTLGTRIFWRNSRLRSLLALNLVVAAPTALVLVNTVVYVRDVLHRPNTDLALALACFGVGSMIVALTAPRVLDRFGDRAVMLTGAVLIPVALAAATALTVVGAAGAGWALLLGLWFLLGAGSSMILTPSSRLLRDASNEETRPYVFTAQFSLSHACYLLSYPLAGWVGAAAGLGWAAAALTFVAMIGSAGAFLSWPRHPVLAPPNTQIEEPSDEQPAGAPVRSGP